MNYEHEIKCQPPFFQDVLDGIKPFEIRNNDRGYVEGDRILMREWIVTGWTCTGRYTGRRLECMVGYCTRYAQKDGFIVFAIRDVRSLPDAA